MADIVFDVAVQSTAVDVIAETAVINAIPLPETVVAVVAIGGPPGPRGAAGGEIYTHTQSAAAATWTITHPLGRKPGSVTVWIADELVHTDIQAPDNQTVVITFPSPTSGYAQLI